MQQEVRNVICTNIMKRALSRMKAVSTSSLIAILPLTCTVDTAKEAVSIMLMSLVPIPVHPSLTM